MRPIPSSPPPSFRSRASSLARRNQVDPDLADAFGDDDEDGSEDEADDRQRLVRQNTTTASSSSPVRLADEHGSSRLPSMVMQRNASPDSRLRVIGGGIGSDGVFANLSAKPDRTESEKDEMPPVRVEILMLHPGES